MKLTFLIATLSLLPISSHGFGFGNQREDMSQFERFEGLIGDNREVQNLFRDPTDGKVYYQKGVRGKTTEVTDPYHVSLECSQDKSVCVGDLVKIKGNLYRYVTKVFSNDTVQLFINEPSHPFRGILQMSLYNKRSEVRDIDVIEKFASHNCPYDTKANLQKFENYFDPEICGANSEPQIVGCLDDGSLVQVATSKVPGMGACNLETKVTEISPEDLEAHSSAYESAKVDVLE